MLNPDEKPPSPEAGGGGALLVLESVSDPTSILPTEDQLVDWLIAAGYGSRKRATTLIGKHGRDRVARYAADYVMAYREGAAKTIGWFVSAIENDWRITHGSGRVELDLAQVEQHALRHGLTARSTEHYYWNNQTGDAARWIPR